MFDHLHTISTEYCMKINIKKTAIMKISKREETVVIKHIKGKEIKQIRELLLKMQNATKK